MLFRCLVPAEATALIVGEDGIARQIEESGGASISVSDECDNPGLSDRIISIMANQQHGEIACKMIIERLYAAQEVAAGDQGIFVLLVPDSFPDSEDLLQKVMEISGADVHLEPDAIAGTDDRAIQIVGGFDATVAAVFQLGAIMASNGDHDEVQLDASYLAVESAGCEAGAEAKPAEEEVEVAKEDEEMSQLQKQAEASKAPESPQEILSEAEPLEEAGAIDSEEIQEIEFLEEADLETAEADMAGPLSKQISLRFAVTSGVAAWVVGKKGQSISNLRNQSKAMIEVSNDVSAYRVINVDGRQDAVMLAIELLLEQINKIPDGSPDSVKIVLPPNSAGYIIGKGGETIKELRRTSQAEVDLDRDATSAAPSQLLKIRGPLKAMIHASRLVAERLSEVTGDRKARSEFEHLQSLLTETNHIEVSLTMLIPADAVNRVPRARLYEVERLTGSHIEVDGLGGRTSGLQQLQMTGTKNSNAMAVFYLQEIFAEHLRSSAPRAGSAPRAKSRPRSGAAKTRPLSRGPKQSGGAGVNRSNRR